MEISLTFFGFIYIYCIVYISNQFETHIITKMVNYYFQASRVPSFLASQTDGDAAQYHGREVLVHVPRVV